MDTFSHIRGFNYQPGYASTSYESWSRFQPDTWRRELQWGKRHFPGMNAVRLWLSFGAWQQNPHAFLDRLHTALGICDELELGAVPCLFNRWHNAFCDNDGLYLDHFVGGVSPWLAETARRYVREVMASYRDAPGILLWDLCNEPFACYRTLAEMGALGEGEIAFLECIHGAAREAGPAQPLGISLSGNDLAHTLPRVEPLCDVLLTHPYLMSHADRRVQEREAARFLEGLDWQAGFAVQVQKPLLVTETCWGSVDPVWRCENMRFTLDALTARGIGFLAHALCHSLVADLHPPGGGPVLDDLGQFNFIGADGSLRPGHELFNRYCGGDE